MLTGRSDNMERVISYSKIPYNLISEETETSNRLINEFIEIMKYYEIYKEGADFDIEGTHGDYQGSNLRYMQTRALINKEARFLFGEAPNIKIEAKGDISKVNQEVKDGLTILNDLVSTILLKNNFEEKLLKAAKDCFIGKRIACLVNFNEEDGVTIQFLPSTQFIYETSLGNSNNITKFVCFFVIKEDDKQKDRRIFKKKYEKDKTGAVWLSESTYDGTGKLVEEITKRQRILLDTIPAIVILNDGITGEENGESEISILNQFESWYSKLSNGDIDAERKSMNPIKYTVDMDSQSTENLKSSAGSYWDLLSDQNLDTPNPKVGTLEHSMNYNNSLDATLKRLKTAQYEQVDVPNITMDSLQGSITSGKSLKAIYWGLVVRCKEKMKTWRPQLETMLTILIEGAFIYKDFIKRYTSDNLIRINYKISIEQNPPLDEDEIEQKTMDLAEVQAQVMSRKSYMKKWRNLTDDDVSDEIKQIALERQIIEDNFSPLQGMENVEAKVEEAEAETEETESMKQ